MMKKCYVDKNIVFSDENRELLKGIDLEFLVYDDINIESENIDYLLLHSSLPDQEFKKMNKCKYIGIRAHNTDYINRNIASEKNVFVEGLKDQHGVNAVAEHTFALIFCITKNIVNSHKNVVEGIWRKNLDMNYELYGKKLGIVGYGKIGKKVAEIGKMLGMEILIAAKNDNLTSGESSIEEVLEESDVVSLHLSTKEENRKYIDKERLKIMKNDSILINTARGYIMDYEALEEELEKGKFLGVGLDVFPEEPIINNSLSKYSNVILTPHVAYLTKESINNMNQELILNFMKFLNVK